MKIIISQILVFILISFSIPALAKITTDCDTATVNDRSFKYCVRKNTESRAVLYYLHGLMGSSSSYKRFIVDDIDPLWIKKGIPVPNIIAVSFGASWIMSDATGGQGIQKYFADTVQPYLEKEFLFDSSFRRMIVGMSMGGFNAVQTFAKNPERYHRAAFLCPALHDGINPFSSKAEIDAFIKRTGASRTLVNITQKIGRDEYADIEDWNQEGPMAVASRMAIVNFPIYIGIGDADQFGFLEGANAFSDLMKTKSPQVDTYVIKDGGHCAYPVQELADYLAPVL